MAKLTEVSGRTITENTKSAEDRSGIGSREGNRLRASLTHVSDHIASPSSLEMRLCCPFCAEETFLGDRFCQECGSIQPAFADKTFYPLEKVRELLSTQKQIAAIILAASVLGGLAFYAIFSYLSLPGEIDLSLKENRLNDAVRLSEKLYRARFGLLTGKEAELYNISFHRRAQVFAANNSAKSALIDLSRILPNYSLKSEAEKLSQVYLASLQASKTADFDKDPEIQKRIAGRPRLALQKLANPIPLEPPQKVLNAGLKNVSEANVVDAGMSVEAAMSSYDQNTKEEKEVASYNCLLAEHFLKKAQSDSTHALSDISKEPPSFSEWMQSGRAKF